MKHIEHPIPSMIPLVTKRPPRDFTEKPLSICPPPIKTDARTAILRVPNIRNNFELIIAPSATNVIVRDPM
jgi:hypothetical protein